jgi:eukaryotic-like serine/threonine-protein kinase
MRMLAKKGVESGFVGAALQKKTCPRCGRAFDADAAFCPSDGTALLPDRDDGPDSDPYIGTILPGDIEIRSVAGAGAMGRVYRAHQRGIDRDVAVKILHRELSGNLPLVQRFHREAKIASKLQHPHVVDVYLTGQLPDGALYIVMEYLDGMSLAAALGASSGMFGLERTMPIALQICDAVGEGHARGIVHRDLKPENVMLVRRADTSDWVKVLDFGIAKVSLGEQSMETAAGLIFGTARYISPEGAQGATVGPPGDVYAIATIVYQMLCGRTPFDAEQPVGLLIKHLHETPPALDSWPTAAKVPAPITRVVMDNLAKDPTRRAPSARALGNALAAAAKEAGVSFSDVGVVARMSVFDGPPPIIRVGSAPAIEPTLDDHAAVPAVRIVTQNTPISKRDAAAEALDVTSAAQPTPKEISERPPPISPTGPGGTLALAAVAPPPLADKPNDKVIDADVSSPSSRRAREKRSPMLLIVLAFLFGVTLAVAVTQHIAHRKDAEHDAYVQKTKKAMAEGRFVDPPGDNVKDLVSEGKKKWPDDPALENLLSDTADELVTRAMAARSGGDVGGARDMVKTAAELDPNDAAAKLLLEQYEDELAAMSEDGGTGGTLHGARVALDMSARSKAGARADLVARILVGTAAKPKVVGAQFVVHGPGLSKDGHVIIAVGSGPFRASFTPPREGHYSVQFEANVDGASVRAERNLQAVGK